jgi:hypothetical protein
LNTQESPGSKKSKLLRGFAKIWLSHGWPLLQTRSQKGSQNFTTVHSGFSRLHYYGLTIVQLLWSSTCQSKTRCNEKLMGHHCSYFFLKTNTHLLRTCTNSKRCAHYDSYWGTLQKAKNDKFDAALFSNCLHSSMYCLCSTSSYHWVFVCLTLMDLRWVKHKDQVVRKGQPVQQEDLVKWTVVDQMYHIQNWWILFKQSICKFWMWYTRSTTVSFTWPFWLERLSLSYHLVFVCLMLS